jgi:hypothetical protein
VSRASNASFNTGRQLPGVEPMHAESALIHHAALLIQVARIVRASLHTVAAADALVIIDKDQAVFAPIRCSCRADAQAGRIFAVHTVAWLKPQSKNREFACRSFLPNPVTMFAEGHLVFDFASDHASLAIDASLGLYDHPPASFVI